jgi:hypothetical protein
MLAVNTTNIFVILGVIATIISLVFVPAGIIFYRRVMRPLRWVLGVSAADSPSGEAVLPVPQQLLELRKNQAQIMTVLGPNGGSSILDIARKSHKLAMSIDRALKKHLLDSAQSEKEIWQAIAGLGGNATAGTTTTTHTTSSTVNDEVDDDGDEDAE